MNYLFEEGILNVYQDGHLNLVQPFNPITGEQFQSESDATDWLANYVQNFYNAGPVAVTMTGEHDGEDIDFDDNIPEVMAEELVSLFIQAPDKCNTTNMHRCQVTIESENFNKSYSFKFKNGKATRNIIIDDPGVYNIYLDGGYATKTDEHGNEIEGKVIVHHKNAYKLKVLPATYTLRP